jgi:hypothetical protein
MRFKKNKVADDVYSYLWTLECSMAIATMRPPMKSMQEDFMKYMLVWAVVIIPVAISYSINKGYQNIIFFMPIFKGIMN